MTFYLHCLVKVVKAAPKLKMINNNVEILDGMPREMHKKTKVGSFKMFPS